MTPKLLISPAHVLGVLLYPALLLAQAPPSAKGTAQPAESAIVIRGVLLDSDRKPVTSPLPGLIAVFGLPVDSTSADGSKLTLTTELLNRNSGTAGCEGSLRLAGATGLQPLKVDGKNAVFDIDEKTTTLNLGTIVVARD